MRQTGNCGATGSALRRSATAWGVAGALLLTGCATQVGGTALTPTSVPQTSTTPTVTNPSTATRTSPSTSSASETTTDLTSTVDTTSADGTSSVTTADRSTSEQTSQQVPTSAGQTNAPGRAIDPAAFAAKLKTANAGVRSLKGSITVAAGPVNVSGTFGETLAGGQVNALDMSMFITSGSQDIPLRMLIVGGKVYVGGTALLKSLNVGTKKWALASKTSSNSTLRTLATQLDGYLTTASANQYELYAVAAKSIVDAGPARLGTVSAHRYDIMVDVAALAKASPPSAKASMEALAKSGVSTLPVSIWLDSSGRLVQSESTVKVSSITSKSDFKVTGYNVPVTIKAPAAADVFTG